MTTTSRTATTRARGMAGTTDGDRTGGMGTGTTHTGSNNSITMTAMTRKDIRTMTICGDHFLCLRENRCYNNITRTTEAPK